MSFHVDRFVGNVTNTPEIREIGAKNTPLLELNLAANAQRKNRDTQKYEPVLDKNGKQKVSWLTVKLWGDKTTEFGDFVKGDLVEYAGSVQEEYFTKRDEAEGRRLESDYVESVTIKFPSKTREPAQHQGFVPPAAPSTGFGNSTPAPSTGFGNAAAANDAPWSKTAEATAAASVQAGKGF